MSVSLWSRSILSPLASHKLLEVVTFPPLRIDEDSLSILSVILKTHFLNLLDLDHFLQALILLRVLIKLTVPQLLLVLLFLLRDDTSLSKPLLSISRLPSFRLDPHLETLLLDLVLMGLELILLLFLLIFLLLPPWHDDGEYGVVAVGEVADCGNSILQERHRVSLGLEYVLLLVLLITSAPRTVIDLLLHHQCRLLIFLLATEKLMK